MKKLTKNQAYTKVPLTEADKDALETLFREVKVEDIRQIEEIAAFYSVAPLDPWEEKGWILNSSLSGFRGSIV